MSIYQYKALTQDGREVIGSLEYAEEQMVLAHLQAQGFIPLDIEKKKDSNSLRLAVKSAPPLRRNIRQVVYQPGTGGRNVR